MFVAGENLLTFQAVDDLPIVTRNRNVGGPGASGFFYDSLALTHDPDAAVEEKLQVALTPTALYPKTDKGVKEECWLTVRFPRSWKGGSARVSIGRFNAEVEIPKPGEFGEARVTVLVPGDLPAGKGKIVLTEKDVAGEGLTFDIDFAPSKKWKVFYAPSMHLDIGYTDYRPKVAEVHSRSVDDLIGVLDAHPDYRFNLDGSWIAEQWLTTRSAAQVDKLVAHAKKGALAPTPSTQAS